MAVGQGDRSWGCAGIALILVALVWISTCSTSGPSTKDQNELEQLTQMARIERLVKARLRDPDSAKFEHLNGGCGHVNSRNGFGGMSGPKQFIVGVNDNVVFEEDDPQAFRAVWNGHCAK